MALFRRRRWPQALAAVGVLAVAGLVAWLVTRDTPAPSAARGGPGSSASASATPPAVIPSGRPLTATLAAGETVGGDRVVVAAVLGPATAWVTPATGGGRVLVRLESDTKLFDFAPGARLTFSGVVRSVTPGLGARFGLPAADAAALAKQRRYVEIRDFAVE